ncbi:hypothetical protein LX32DRAFT_698811 [Colletotrichum zoysiae]|uniref:DUF6546 domain-containing protein n=1 Tax=Colletotrichum zoysiae TaxID=1216348 RepID=A0AAD9H4K8_9PEZI|nr:hypothetical protein LX32DRAFT_698811 [Colletotrichum zoysiae]
MEEEEEGAAVLDGVTLLAYMRESWETGCFRLNYAARNSWAFDAVFWNFLDERFFDARDLRVPDEQLWKIMLDLSDHEEQQAMEPFVKRKMEESWERILVEWKPAEARQVTFYLTNASLLSGGITPRTVANTIHGWRLLGLKKLSLVIDFDPSSFTTIIDSRQRQIRLGGAFVDVVDGIVNTLEGWKRDALFDLEIHEERSCGHHLNHFGSELVHGPRRSIDCVRSIRHAEYSYDRCRCCSYRGLLSHLCSAMSESDSLKDISYAYQERDHRNRAIQYEGWDFLPSGVRSLTVHGMDEPNDACEMLSASGVSRRTFRMIGRQLEALHVSHYMDVLSLGLTLSLPWPHLRNLSITLSAFEMDNEVVETEMIKIAKAAREMPNIRQIELWSVCRGSASYFCYAIKKEDARAIWQMNRDFRVSEALANEWASTARHHTSQELTIEVRKVASADERRMIPPYRAATELFQQRLYAADCHAKHKFGIPYSQRFEYAREYDIWGSLYWVK